MSRLIRHAIIKDGIVINVVEYATEQTGAPLGFDDNVVAVPNATASPGWVYAGGVFSDPNPPAVVPVEAKPEPTKAELAAAVQALADKVQALK